MRVGREISRQSAGGRAFNVVMALATLAVILSVSGVVAIFATYEGRAARDGARTPVGVEEGDATFSWSWDPRLSIDGDYVDVIHVEPLIPDAPLPPGLDRWPAPGEVIASPAMLAHPDFASWVSQVGYSTGAAIGPVGLTDANERLAYHRPVVPYSGEGAIFASSYGVPHDLDTGVIGSALRIKPLAVFLEIYTAFVILPAIILLVVATRIDGSRRNQRLALVRTLGGTLRHRAALTFGAAATGVTSGISLASGVIAAFLIVDVEVPVVGYKLQAADVRAASSWLVVAAVLAICLVITGLLVAHRGKLTQSTRGAQVAGLRVRPIVMAICPIVTWLAVLAYGQAIPYGPNVTTLTYYVGVLAAAVSLPYLVAGTTTAVAGVALKRAHRHGRAGTIAATQQLLFDSRGVLKIGAALAVVILLAVQVQIFSSKLSAQAVEADQLQRTTGSRVLDADLEGGPDQIRAAAEVLSEHGELLLYAGSPDPGDRTVRLFGTCDALRAASLPCSEGERSDMMMTDEARAVVGLAGGSSVSVEIANPIERVDTLPGEWWRNYALVSRDSMDPAAINAQLSTISTPSSVVSVLSDSWRVAANDSTAKAGWLTIFGWCTVGLLALALGAASLSEHLDITRTTRAWSVLGASPWTVAAANGWRIMLPMGLSLMCGIAITIWLAQPVLLPSQGGQLPTVLLGGIAGIATVIGVVVWGFATYLGVRDMRAWRPGDSR